MARFFKALDIATGESLLIPESSVSGGGEIAATTADFVDSTGVLANVTGMSFPIAANETVTAVFQGFWETSANNYGMRYALTGPPSPTSVIYGGEIYTSLSAKRTLSAATAFATDLFETIASAGIVTPFIIYAHIVNGANAGTVQLQIGGESNIATLTVKRGLTQDVKRIP